MWLILVALGKLRLPATAKLASTEVEEDKAVLVSAG
jgi:hypothetical protein